MTTPFIEMGLNPQLLNALEALGFTEATPVQAALIPKALEGGDVEMLQDLVLTAVNEAVRIGRATMDREVSAITGGIKLPGII